MAMTQSVSEFNLQVSFVDGVNATTATMTGVATEDKIVSAWLFSTKASVATVEDITSDVTITAANTITVGTDYTNDLMVIFWLDRSI